MAADQQVRVEVISRERKEDEDDRKRRGLFFIKAFIVVKRIFDYPEEAVDPMNRQVDEGLG